MNRTLPDYRTVDGTTHIVEEPACQPSTYTKNEDGTYLVTLHNEKPLGVVVHGGGLPITKHDAEWAPVKEGDDPYDGTVWPPGVTLDAFDAYRRDAARTLPPNTSPRDALNIGALGLAGESGEVIELVKKHLFHGHALDRERLKKELGDVLWYLAAICTAEGLSLGDVADANIAKLRARYPEGFTSEKSQNRKAGDE